MDSIVEDGVDTQKALAERNSMKNARITANKVFCFVMTPYYKQNPVNAKR